MSLPEGFVFSQKSLRAYADCPRLFQLYYLLNVAWPAPETGPEQEAERHMRLGRAFHLLVQQHGEGIPESLLSSMERDDDLDRWWKNYLEHPPSDLPSEVVRAEIGLSVPVKGHRLTARYDRVCATPGERIVIVDWKTSHKRAADVRLEEHMQTRVYRYVMAQAGAVFNGGVAPRPEQVEMVYWFAEHPEQVARFAYDQGQFEADDEYLCSLIEEIGSRDEERWPSAEGGSRCRFCRYRSLCDRGTVAGSLADLEDDLASDDEWSFDLDLEQIAEIEF